MIPMKTVALATLLAMTAGCTTVAHKEAIDHSGSEIEARNERHLTSMMASERTTVRSVPRAWLAPKSINLGEDAALPAEFSNEKKWPFGVGWRERANLRTVAERVAKISGIPVRINPDVFQKSIGSDTSISGVASSSAAASSGAAPSGATPFPPPSQPPNFGLSGSPSLISNASEQSMDMNFTGSLGEFLNRTATHFGINWEYKNGSIHFYRYVTKMFRVNANPGDSTFNSSLGKTSSGGGSGGSSGGSSGSGGGSSFNSSGQVSMNATFSVWDTLTKELDSVKTAEGKVTISQATGTVLMRDTRDAVEAAERIIAHENALLTQQVAISVEMYAVTSNDSRDLGVNWSLVYQKLSNLTPQFKLDLTSPSSLTSASSGSLGLSILAPATNDHSILQRFSGSQAILQALEGVGRVHHLQTAEAVTLNRQPIPMAATRQQTYLASTTPGSSGTGGGSALPGLTPGTVTTGFMTNILPSVMENGSIMLQFSLDSSQLESLGIISTGEGVTKQSIQTPNVTDNSTIQRVALKEGATLVLTGMRRNTEQYDQSTLTGQVGLGGSYTGNRERETVVIMVTAKLIPGG